MNREIIECSKKFNKDDKFIFPEENTAGSSTPPQPGYTASEANLKALQEPLEKGHQGTGSGWNMTRPKGK